MLKDETGKKKSITQKIIIKRIRVKTKIKNKLDVYFLRKREKKKKENDYQRQTTHHLPLCTTLEGRGCSDTSKNTMKD